MASRCYPLRGIAHPSRRGELAAVGLRGAAVASANAAHRREDLFRRIDAGERSKDAAKAAGLSLDRAYVLLRARRKEAN